LFLGAVLLGEPGLNVSGMAKEYRHIAEHKRLYSAFEDVKRSLDGQYYCALFHIAQ